ncbi:MAG: hypothetical protein F6J86_01270 [Symploca sp. SIO1B1]|nr:hypothetical protein [Symploca sp. SIO1C2]NER47047.1 hypothetical protein [Symploca sp. SIO1A3]NER92493.1 hypothetical protein [Symploca sp. SIO1B1]
MGRISTVVQQAITTGYLTVAAEQKLRQLLTTSYDHEDFQSFINLQQYAMEGMVKQQSREKIGNQDYCVRM